jgi:hypothetical protein
MAYDVTVLDTAKGFLDNLEPKLRAKSYRTIKMLTQFGPVLTLPHSRKIVGTKDLYELSGFIKKQQKTDPNEIKKALDIRRKYIENKINETDKKGDDRERI